MSRELKLNWVEMENFKGAKNLRIDFTDETTLRGDNATFKSTTVDAIYWGLFGKNAEDNTKFSVKPLDKNKKTDPKNKTKVTTGWTIDGVQEVFSRGVVEKWVKPHGEVQKVYEGDVTKFEINGVPKQKKEFDIIVGSIISGPLFRVLSNPMEFNRLKWEVKRELLIKIIGEIDESKVLSSIITVSDKGDYNGLIGSLNSGSLENYKLELAAKIRPIKKALEAIPIQIEEKQRDVNQIEVLDWSDLNTQIEAKKALIVGIDETLQDSSKKHTKQAEKQTLITKQIGEKKIKLQEIENEAKIEANKGLNKKLEEKAKLTTKHQSLLLAEGETKKVIGAIQNNLEKQDVIKKESLEKYHKIKTTVFEIDENETKCPTCEVDKVKLHKLFLEMDGQSETIEEIENILDIKSINEQVEEMEGNFNSNKAELLAENVKAGKAINKLIKEFKAKEDNNEAILKKTKSDIEAIKLKIAAIGEIDETEKPVDLSNNQKHIDCANEIEALQKSVIEVKPADNSKLKLEKETINVEIDSLKTSLNGKVEIDKAEKRISELETQQTKLAQEEANLEKEQNAIEKFERAKMDVLETKVNGLFQTVTFKMFEKQKNGGKKDDCICLINGVPYSDANTASKINAGVDICNVLQEFNKYNIPIIVDNRESVTTLVKTKSQIINLFKDENYKTLTVE